MLGVMHWNIVADATSLASRVPAVVRSGYGTLQGAWPFGLVEGVWAMVALWRWRRTQIGRNNEAGRQPVGRERIGFIRSRRSRRVLRSLSLRRLRHGDWAMARRSALRPPRHSRCEPIIGKRHRRGIPRVIVGPLLSDVAAL